MWAVGCILTELLLRVPFLPGDSDLDQLSKIFETLGTPTEAMWPGMTQLPDYIVFKDFPGIPLSQCFSAATDDLLELISGLLRYNPVMRLTASQALQLPFFANFPPPTPSKKLPLPASCASQLAKDLQRKKAGTKRKGDKDVDMGGLAKRLVF
uniref:[RNA-polymerase]-subunit kinase n=1 Tax=Phallusia mammillata TaxID=59560 RepID=A0A6F9D9P4_9ASCI|nr:cyclin-dependent kinase 7-like [Phallusia mammillata]